MARMPANVTWDSDVYVSLWVAQNLTGRCRSLLRRLCREGVIPSKRASLAPNSAYMVRPCDLRDWVRGLPDGAQAS